MSEVKNPCTGLCKFRDEVCLGCGRKKSEAKEWKKLGKADKRTIVAKAEKRLDKLKSIRKGKQK